MNEINVEMAETKKKSYVYIDTPVCWWKASRQRREKVIPLFAII